MIIYDGMRATEWKWVFLHLTWLFHLKYVRCLDEKCLLRRNWWQLFDDQHEDRLQIELWTIKKYSTIISYYISIYWKPEYLLYYVEGNPWETTQKHVTVQQFLNKC